MRRVLGSVFGIVLLAIGAGAQEGDGKAPEWLVPSMHISAAAGSSSADRPAELMAGHHDPSRTDGTVQGIELGLSLRTPFHLEGFATYNISYGAEEEWEDKWEEAFLKLAELPGGLSLRGGRLLTRFGLRNATHLHAWNTVDTPLVLGRFLGDDGMSIDGGDVNWIGSTRSWHYALIGGYGKVNTHADGHSDQVDEHRHEHFDPWSNQVGYGRAFAIFQDNDFSTWQLGLSWAGGDNARGKTIPVWGTDLKYEWRENGFLPGGRAFTWNTEVLRRSIDFEREDSHGAHEGHADEDEEYARASEWGLYTEGLYSWNPQWTTGLRLGYVEGVAAVDLEERYRVSPILTWKPRGDDLLAFRIQYNYDHLEHTEEHSIWAQISLAWGGPEVR